MLIVKKVFGQRQEEMLPIFSANAKNVAHLFKGSS